MTTIYFDLDGTLTDPKTGITRSIQYALEKLGHAAPPEDELIWCIGPPLRDSFRVLLGDDRAVETAILYYRERFADVGLFENAIYPGIDDILSHLHKAGRRLFVATSKPAVYAERIVAHFGMARCFERVFGAELDGRLSDKTELLRHALSAAKVDPQQAIMIGDRKHDILGARNNTMTAIGVLYGYGSKDELVTAGAHHVCSEPRQLLGHID